MKHCDESRIFCFPIVRSVDAGGFCGVRCHGCMVVRVTAAVRATAQPDNQHPNWLPSEWKPRLPKLSAELGAGFVVIDFASGCWLVLQWERV